MDNTADIPPSQQSDEEEGQSVLDYMDECRHLWRAKAHQIINDHMDRAARVADVAPAIRLLIPSIRTTLHDLFDHMVSSPLEYADHQRAIAETEAANTALAERVHEAAPEATIIHDGQVIVEGTQKDDGAETGPKDEQPPEPPAAA